MHGASLDFVLSLIEHFSTSTSTSKQQPGNRSLVLTAHLWLLFDFYFLPTNFELSMLACSSYVLFSSRINARMLNTMTHMGRSFFGKHFNSTITHPAQGSFGGFNGEMKFSRKWG